MRALVTGGCGFIGSHLCERLLREGVEVLAVARPGEVIPVEIKGECAVESADIMDAQAMERLMKGVDMVFHLAARTDLRGTSIEEYEVNTRGTEIVLRAAEREGVKRFVLYSSMLAVALTGSTEPIDENFQDENPVMYGRSKRKAEEIVKSSTVAWTIIRPTLVFGPRERATMQAFFQAVASRKFMLIGGNVTQSFVYVKNLVDATVKAALSQAGANQVFFVSDERPYTLKSFAACVAQSTGVRLNPVVLPRWFAMFGGLLCDMASSVLGKELPLSRRRVRTMTTNYVYDISRVRNLIQWNAPYDMKQGIEETVSWYSQNGILG